jgi:hypothetical protein
MCSVSNLSTFRQLSNPYTPYSGDVYGCHAPLVKKRAERNFRVRTHGYHVGVQKCAELLEWSPKDGKQILPGSHPWGKEQTLWESDNVIMNGGIQVGMRLAQIAQSTLSGGRLVDL